MIVVLVFLTTLMLPLTVTAHPPPYPVDDLTDPTITSNLRAILYFEGQVGNSITWYVSDDHPGTYMIIVTFPPTLIAPLTIKSGFWNHSSETITLGVDGLTAGNYAYSLIVYDGRGNKASNRVHVTVLTESEAVQRRIVNSVVIVIILVTGAILIRGWLEWRRPGFHTNPTRIQNSS